MIEIVNQVVGFISQYSWLVLLSIAILPGLCFPASVLYTMAGVVFGPTWQTCILVMGALSLNLFWTYLLARSPLSQWLRTKTPSKWDYLLDINPKNAARITILLRITPGLPLCFQSYFLGLLKVRFKVYFPISVIISSLWSCMFVVTGGSLIQGKVKFVVYGVIFGICLFIVTKIWQSRIKTQ